jgi:hypothetical protein
VGLEGSGGGHCRLMPSVVLWWAPDKGSTNQPNVNFWPWVRRAYYYRKSYHLGRVGPQCPACLMGGPTAAAAAAGRRLCH